MIKLLDTVPKSVTIACSGGLDSMVLVDFLRRKHLIELAFFDHGTTNSKHAITFLSDWAHKQNLKLHIGTINNSDAPRGVSPEEWWRIQRYKFLEGFHTVATAHHLDDVVETWVWSSLHGTSSLIPHRRNNVIRPLLLNKKQSLLEWARKQNVQWIEDDSNNNLRYTRNYIRSELMPHVLRVNPGIHRTLSKKLIERQKSIKMC